MLRFQIRSWLCYLCILLAVAGCSRTAYRIKADGDAYCILEEKAAATQWQPPTDFSIQPDPRARFFDSSPADDPALPIPAPQLYAYRLPKLSPRDPRRFDRLGQSPLAPALAQHVSWDAGPPIAPPPKTSAVQLASHEQPLARHELLARLQPLANGAAADGVLPIPQSPPDDANTTSNGASAGSPTSGIILVPIPAHVWQSLPSRCTRRMFEFDSVCEEYSRTFQREPSADQRDASRRLSLEDIVALALLNSRAYQTEKELLYSAALRLSLERFDYQLKFTAGGNTTAVDYAHDRVGGITTDTLAVPTRVTTDKVLATGGDLLARFANDVVLTFNGPDGFAAAVGSELLFDISQSLLQRDIVFERLTQAERDVVYAARRFARFRKELFRDLADQYYALILTFRAIEIDSQNYFSNLRAFHQGEAEYRGRRRSRVEVDQFEQSALQSRSELIRGCNNLEGALDRLKLQVGLPPETPVNVDLTELEMLTLRDENAVWGDRVRRARDTLLRQRAVEQPDRGVLLNGAIDLTRRMLTMEQLRTRLHSDRQRVAPLELTLARLNANEAQMLVDLNREVLRRERSAVPPPPPVRVFQRTMDLVDSSLALVDRQLAVAERLAAAAPAVDALRMQSAQLRERLDEIDRQLREVVAARQLDRIPDLVTQAAALLTDVDVHGAAANALLRQLDEPTDEGLPGTLDRVDQLLDQSARLLAEQGAGLTPVQIDGDDAMLTALVCRFDLMNERGALADAWRQVKLAGDDLRTVLNLNATQSIRTQHNRPFGFTFDESQTRLSLQVDTPLNRKAQQVAYRQSLINYQAALRNLIELEDEIKLSVRDDLRRLLLDREQYHIAVASAALAYDRVISTRLQLRLGRQGVAARDFLEAQQAYTASLNAVAAEHIGYILDRIELFHDLELLEVDDRGFWPELYNERFQPTAQGCATDCAPHPYGELPAGVCYSPEIKRMVCVPPGTPTVHRQQQPLKLEPLPKPPPLSE